MKIQRIAWALLLLLTVVLPCAADGHKGGQEEEDTVLGTWYAQYIEGDVMPAEMTMSLDIKEDGMITGTMVLEGEEPDVESWTYTHDKKNAILTLYKIDEDGNAEAEIEVELSYSFVDDMLIFRFQDGPDDEIEAMELTRNPDGTKRHQKLREEMKKEQGQGDAASHAMDEAVEEKAVEDVAGE